MSELRSRAEATPRFDSSCCRRRASARTKSFSGICRSDRRADVGASVSGVDKHQESRAGVRFAQPFHGLGRDVKVRWGHWLGDLGRKGRSRGYNNGFASVRVVGDERSGGCYIEFTHAVVFGELGTGDEWVGVVGMLNGGKHGIFAKRKPHVAGLGSNGRTNRGIES